MRTLTLVAVIVFAASVALAAAPAKKPAPKGGKPGATPAASPEASPAKAKEPEKNECTGTAKDGSNFSASNSDYQGCLRDITAQVKAKSCKDGDMQVEFTFHRGGKQPILQTAVCN